MSRGSAKHHLSLQSGWWDGWRRGCLTEKRQSRRGNEAEEELSCDRKRPRPRSLYGPRGGTEAEEGEAWLPSRLPPALTFPRRPPKFFLEEYAACRGRVVLDRLLPGGTVLLDSPSVHTSDPLRPSGRKRSGHLGCSVVPPSEPASSHLSHVPPEDAGTRNLAGPLTRTISELYDRPVPVP